MVFTRRLGFAEAEAAFLTGCRTAELAISRAILDECVRVPVAGTVLIHVMAHRRDRLMPRRAPTALIRVKTIQVRGLLPPESKPRQTKIDARKLFVQVTWRDFAPPANVEVVCVELNTIRSPCGANVRVLIASRPTGELAERARRIHPHR